MKQLVRDVGVSLARRFGMKIRDHRTGDLLGRALIVPWRGRIHVIGFEAAVRPEFIPQQRLTYWKQELGFSAHEAVDFEYERANGNHEPATSAHPQVADQR